MSHQARPNWSVDGRWLYFASDREDGWQVWKMRSSGGPAFRVTRKGGFEAAESGDGRFIYYAKRFHSGVWRLPSSGGPESRVLDRAEEGQWKLTRHGIYVLTRQPSRGFILEFFNFGTRHLSRSIDQPSNAISLAYNVMEPSLSVSPDGRNILFAQMDQADTDIMIVDGFRE
jgi:Tol biopolymer transport system component